MNGGSSECDTEGSHPWRSSFDTVLSVPRFLFLHNRCGRVLPLSVALCFERKPKGSKPFVGCKSKFGHPCSFLVHVLNLQAVMLVVDATGDAYPSIGHAPWDGLHLADFVMPYFLLISGISASISLKAGWPSGFCGKLFGWPQCESMDVSFQLWLATVGLSLEVFFSELARTPVDLGKIQRPVTRVTRLFPETATARKQHP